MSMPPLRELKRGLAINLAIIFKPMSAQCMRVGENTTDGKPLPQISPLEARINLRYIQDNYTLGAFWRVVDGQNRISAVTKAISWVMT